MTCVELHRHGRRVHKHPYQARHRHVPGLLRRSVAVPHLHQDRSHEHSVDHDGVEQHPHSEHRYEHDGGQLDANGHGHTHGLVDESIKRSRAGLSAVGWSLAVLGATALAQTAVFLTSGSVALLADLIHNAGDALTALPLPVALVMRSSLAWKPPGWVDL